MNSTHPNILPGPWRLAGRRGSVLITALLVTAVIGLTLVSYVQVCTNSARLAHRTLFANSSENLVEAGLEEAVWCYNQMGSGVAPATAWSGWTLNTSTNEATFTLPTFNLDQGATGVVKVYVNGYDGTNFNPVVVSKAMVTPYDGKAPIIKITQVTLGLNNPWANGVVAKNGITFKGRPTANSFVSSASPLTGPYMSYPGISGARANTTVADLAGSISLGAQGLVSGNVYLGNGVTVSGGTITGTTSTGFNRTLTMPVYPTAASVSNSYNLGASLPATLPRNGDTAASDGKYYYFVSGAGIGATTISAGNNVVVVGSGNTSVGPGLTIGPTGSLKLYIDGPVNASGNGAINNGGYAGALQIFTSTTSDCSIGGNGIITACLYCPNASLRCDGGGNTGMLIGSFVANTITSNGHMDFHYDESLGITGGQAWNISMWRELQSNTERALYASNLNF